MRAGKLKGEVAEGLGRYREVGMDGTGAVRGTGVDYRLAPENCREKVEGGE